MLSIIVTAYNLEDKINICLETVLNQTFRDFEVIVVDDGSTDQTGVICQQLAEQHPQLSYVKKENGGVSSARNFGLERAKGDWIGFVDGDDILPDNMYEVLLRQTQESGCKVGYCEMVKLTGMCFSSVRNDQSRPTPFLKEKQVLKDDELWKWFFDLHHGFLFYSVCNKVFHRSAIESLRFHENYSMGEDMYFCFQLFQKEPCFFTPDTYYGYVLWPQSGSHSKGFHSKRTESVLLAEQMERELREADASDNILGYAKEHIVNNMMTLIFDYYKYEPVDADGQFRKTVQEYKKALRKQYRDYMSTKHKLACDWPVLIKIKHKLVSMEGNESQHNRSCI
ncbi:MAG: glycosyltransferase family 2 protein [Erysipelotrichaceae bacterium]|nr:glycosyltransferase family 2 protein [Erysipelotrichaceae bacterium]